MWLMWCLVMKEKLWVEMVYRVCFFFIVIIGGYLFIILLEIIVFRFFGLINDFMYSGIFLFCSGLIVFG